MRYILTGSGIFLALLAVHGWGDAVTTAPAVVSEVQQLRAQVKALQAENDTLRGQLAALTAGNPPAPAPKAAPDAVDAPLNGLDALFQGFPKEQVPGPDDPNGGLRHSLMRKWAVEQGAGKLITLKARFADATGISGGHFTVRAGTGIIPQSGHPFEVTVTLPELEATGALHLRKWSPVQITGRIKSIEVSKTNEGLFMVVMSLDQASMISEKH